MEVKMSNIKKQITLALTAMLMLSGCSEDKKEDISVTENNNEVTTVQETQKVAEKKIFYSKCGNIEIPEEFELVGQLCYSNGKIYAYCVSYTEDFKVNQHCIMSFEESGKFINSFPMELGENATLPTNITVDSEGGVYCIVHNYSDATETYNLKYIDSSGIEKHSIDVTNLAEYYGSDYFYINNICNADNRNVYIQNDLAVINYSVENGVNFSIKSENNISYIKTVVKNQSGTFLLYYDVDWKFHIAEIKADGSLGEDSVIEGETENLIFVNQNDSNDILCYDNKNLYSMDIKTGDKKQILNWAESGIIVENTHSVTVLSDGKVAVSYYDTVSSSLVAVLLEEAEGEDRKIINLAGKFVDEDIYSAAIKFNESNKEYRIRISEFNETDEFPDIIVMNNETSFESVRDSLTDIYPFMDSDSEIKRTDYLENVLEAFTVDGKLLSIAPSFSIETLVGKKSVLTDKTGWTFDEFIDYCDTLPEGKQIFNDETQTAESMLSMFYKSVSDEFIDYENKTCNFNDDNFIKLLEFASKYKTNEEYYNEINDIEDYEAYYNETNEKYKSGEIILNRHSFVDLTSVSVAETSYFGEEVGYIGYPSKDKNGNYLATYSNFGISEKSENKEAAWQFIKYFLTDEYQEKQISFPVKISAFEKSIAEHDIENKEKYVEFIKSVNKRDSSDMNIIYIIEQECSNYFAGTQDVKQTAENIQTKVMTYIN